MSSDLSLSLGDPCPDFELPGVDGQTYRLSDFKGKKALCVVFMCNHCPYVKATIDRLISIQRDYANKGFQMVGINSNETINYPEDDMPHMVRWFKEKNFNFPYLRDDTQKTAKVFGAQRTPQIFLFDGERKLRYEGAIDDSTMDASKVKRQFLQEAIDSLLSGKDLKETQTNAMGCTIKWA